MTPRQVQWVSRYGPLISLLVGGTVAWTTLKRDVQDSVRSPRFEAESLRVRYRLDSDDRRLDALERQQREYLRAICVAVKCTEPR